MMMPIQLHPTLLVLALAQIGNACAQEAPTVLVAGKRASLISAQDIKRERIGIVDAVVAEDITRMPDVSVTDALQRITGVQILRDRGEGAGVAIRGLTQMETTLKGREVFTAGTGRNLDFADIPAELLAGIDVYKTSSADLPERGVGGTIDWKRTMELLRSRHGQYPVLLELREVPEMENPIGEAVSVFDTLESL